MALSVVLRANIENSGHQVSLSLTWCMIVGFFVPLMIVAVMVFFFGLIECIISLLRHIYLEGSSDWLSRASCVTPKETLAPARVSPYPGESAAPASLDSLSRPPPAYTV